MAPPSVPTHAHNKAPTADRLVAGGGFSLDVAQRQNAFARQDTLYIGIADRSARPFVRQRPEGAAFVDARQLVGRHSAQGLRHVRAPFGQVHAKSPWFFAFPLHFSEKNPPFQKTLLRFARSLRRRARHRPRGAGEKFHIAAEKVRRNAHAFTFFYFCLLSMRGKHAIFASKTCFINSAWQKRGRSSPFFVSPPECPDTSLPSL